jgi:hypothetical protein
MGEESSLEYSRSPSSFVNLPLIKVMKEGDQRVMAIPSPVRTIPGMNAATPGMLSESGFPPIKEMGKESSGNKSKAAVASSSSRARPSVQPDQFISQGIFRIAKNEEQEWRIKQAEEIKAMMFKSPQPQILQEAMEHINSEFTLWIEEEDLSALDLASMELEAVLRRMEKLGKQVAGVQSADGGTSCNGPDGPMLPMMHEVIHNHSRIRPHARWVWVTKSSIVDGEGNLAFPASKEEVCRFGASAHRVFLRQPPSELHHSFAQAVMG